MPTPVPFGVLSLGRVGTVNTGAEVALVGSTTLLFLVVAGNLVRHSAAGVAIWRLEREPFAATYSLTELGKHAEYGECELLRSAPSDEPGTKKQTRK